MERLYIAAHTLSGTSASYGFPRFSEIAAKLAHVFQYALNAPLGDDLHGPLTEFLSDGISLLETGLLEISDTGKESLEDVAAFKERYRFAFPPEPPPLNLMPSAVSSSRPPRSRQARLRSGNRVSAATGSYFDALPADDEVPDEILEFFQPEAEEHLQVVSDCLISLEGNNNPEEINRLFRAIHTVKGSAAQVGLRRLGAIAHRVEDLIGRLRDGEIRPSPAVVDICLESVDVLKKTLHRRMGRRNETCARAWIPCSGELRSLRRWKWKIQKAPLRLRVSKTLAPRRRKKRFKLRADRAAAKPRTAPSAEASRRCKVCAHRAGAARPHDEYGRRAGHQPYARWLAAWLNSKN